MTRHLRKVRRLALADLTSLRQIAINLISNASKYAPVGAAIEVAIRGAGAQPRCVLVVEVNGPGIPQPVLDRVAQPFLRGAATRNGQQSSGLGLHVTLRLCEAMQATLQVKRRENGGTRATLRLPAVGRRRGCEPRLVVC